MIISDLAAQLARELNPELYQSLNSMKDWKNDDIQIGVEMFRRQIKALEETIQAAIEPLQKDQIRLNRLIESGAPTFLENHMGIVCLDDQMGPDAVIDEEPMTNFKHWPTHREAIDHMGERTSEGIAFLEKIINQ